MERYLELLYGGGASEHRRDDVKTSSDIWTCEKSEIRPEAVPLISLNSLISHLA